MRETAREMTERQWYQGVGGGLIKLLWLKERKDRGLKRRMELREKVPRQAGAAQAKTSKERKTKRLRKVKKPKEEKQKQCRAQ